MKKILFLFFLFIHIFIDAQTVYLENGYPVIDLSALDATGITTTQNNRIIGTPSKSAFLNGTTTANSTTPSYSGSYMICGEWNKKISRKFQIMNADLGNTTYKWVDAYVASQTYSEEGGNAGQWRLPTLRELLIIWSLYPQLVNLGSNVFTPFYSTYYWTCSEYDASTAWHVNWKEGKTEKFRSKVYDLGVRLIRDLN